MPHLIVRGVTEEALCAISTPLVDELAQLLGCGTDNFMLELIHTTAISGGAPAPAFPFVEVAWFERGTETRDRFAEIVTRHIRSAGVPEVETAFVTYREDSYYVNGERCFG